MCLSGNIICKDPSKVNHYTVENAYALRLPVHVDSIMLKKGSEMVVRREGRDERVVIVGKWRLFVSVSNRFVT